MSPANTSLLIITLVSILLIAMSANYYIYQQQERNRQRSMLAKKLRHDAEQLLDTLTILKQLQCPKSVIDLLNNEVVDMLGKIAQLKPQSGVIEQLQSQIPIAPEQPQNLNLDNENAMKQAHSAIRATIRFIHQRRSLGALSSIKCDEFTQALQWLDSKIEIETHTDTGKRLLNSDKPVLAISRFKLAKHAIARLPYKEPQRQILMEEINQLIAQTLPFGTAPATSAVKTGSHDDN